MSDQPKIYRVFVAVKGTGKVLHAGEAELGARGIVSRFGTALCGVHTGLYPDFQDTRRTTCRRCKAKLNQLRKDHAEQVEPLGSDLQHPMIVDRDDLDLSELRAHCKTMHRRHLSDTMPRSNRDLAAWHARQHHKYHLDHIHRGLFVLVRQPSDHGRKPVGQIVRPLGNYTGQLAVTREELNAELRERIARRKTP